MTDRTHLARAMCVVSLVAASGGSGWAQSSGLGAVDAVSRLNQPRFGSRIGNAVDAATGAFILDKQILTLQGGRDLTFDLTYNSLLSGNAGAMGFGWSHQYESYIDGDPSGVTTVHWDVLRQNSFRYAGSGQPYDPIDEAVRYDQLVRNSDGSWRLVRQDGTRYEFTSSGQLSRIGNKVYQYLEVQRSNGLPSTINEPIASRKLYLHYTRDGSRMIQSVSDEIDRYVYFGYDSSRRLTVVKGPVTVNPQDYGGAFVPKPIPDNDPNGVTQTIAVNRTQPIGLVLLKVANLDHARPSDLTVTLISPSGTRAVIQNPSVEPTSISPNVWDLSGMVLDNFDGENPQGTWTVLAVDSRSGSTGELNGWQMRFSEPSNPVRYEYQQGMITRAIGPSGEQMFANQYDLSGRVMAQDDGVEGNLIATLTYEDIAGGGIRTTYRDRMANTHVLEHDAGYHLVRRTDPLGHTTTFSYNQNGDRTRLTDALGRITVFGYDPKGNLITVVDPALNTWTMTYDSNNNLLTIRDALGRTSNFQYDNNNNLRRVTDALGNSDTKTYGGNSQLGGSLLQDGAGINYSYQNGMPTSASLPTGGGSDKVEYDPIGRPTRLVDADGFGTQIEYDSQGNVARRTDPIGKVTQTVYDRRNRVIARVDRAGGVIAYEYDGNDNLTAVTDALGNSTHYTYDGEDRLITTIDPLGNKSTTDYDAVGRVIAETNAANETLRYGYDAVGNQTEVFDPAGTRINKTTYDELNLPVTVEDADGRVTTTTYDAVSRAVAFEDSLHRKTTLKYDDLDRLTEVRDPLNRAARETYESDDVVSSIQDPTGFGESFTYDPANRITRVSTPGGSTRYTYNGRDLVTTTTFPSGAQLRYSYDDAGRLLSMSPSGPGFTAPVLSYGYDDNGNLTGVSRKAFDDIAPVLRLSRRYDAANRMIRYTDAAGNVIQYGYDPAGNLTTLTYPDGSKVTYSYDAAGRMAAVTDWAGRVTRYTYGEDGRLAGIAFPNGTRRLMEYNAAGQVSHRRDITPQGGIIVEYRYAYDAAGQMTVEASNSAPATVPQTASMTYAAENQLAEFAGQPVSFDATGNMTNGPLGNGFGRFFYDYRSNLLTAGSVNYSYDEEDRLIGYAQSGRTTRFVVDPQPSLSRVLMKTESDGTVTRYVYGIGLIYEETGGATRTYHYDHRGSTAAFTSDDGSISGTVAYGPYGEILDRTGDTDSPFLFGGLFGVITDPNGLYNMRFRWYSPDIRRFISRDAHFGGITDIGSLNRYTYGGGNPIMTVDPHGEWWVLIGALLGAAYGVASQAVSDLVSGQKPNWKNYVSAAIGGAVYGATLAACPACGFTAGAASAAAQSLTDSLLNGKPVDPLKLAETTLIGGATGKLFQAAGSGFSRRLVTEAKPASLLNTSSFFRKIPANRLAIRFKPITGNPNSLREILRVGGGLVKSDAAFWLVSGVAGGAAKGATQRLGLTSGSGDDQSAGAPKGSGSEDNLSVSDTARNEINQGSKSTYGEFIHWRFYLDSLRLAGRVVPNNPNNLLTSF